MYRSVITIDGCAAAGKGTLARRIAEYFDINYLDTGLLYRAVGALMLDRCIDLDDELAACTIAQQIDCRGVFNLDLMGPEIGNSASRIAVYAGVRAALLGFQRDFACTPPGAVLDGRDVGTVVCPEACVKFFVTANVEERTRRRILELGARGYEISYEEVYRDLVDRDTLDTNRLIAPLKIAPAACVLDTSLLGCDEVFDIALDAIRASEFAISV